MSICIDAAEIVARVATSGTGNVGPTTFYTPNAGAWTLEVVLVKL